MESIEIKQITTDDLHLVITLFNQYRIFYNQQPDLEGAQRFLEGRIKKGESIIFAAHIGKTGQRMPAGFTQLYPIFSSVRMTKNWILNDLFVDEHYRNQGIGKKLIEAACEFAVSSGAGFMQLETANTNESAQRLYERLGFKKQAPDEGFLTYRFALTKTPV